MVFVGEVPKGFRSQIVRLARRKLTALDVAVRLEDLRSPPGNRLEALSWGRAGQHSISVNDNGACASSGATAMCMMWKSLTIIRGL